MRSVIMLCLIAAATAQNSGYNYNRNAATLPVSVSQTHAINSVNTHVLNSAPRIQVAPVQNEFTKEFYTFTAPEESFAVPQIEQQSSESSKKNLQVIFIHAPQQSGLQGAVQNLVRQRLEQQTAIYVLTKQADLSQLQHSLNAPTSHVAHKPEVHFVKYRTPEDAAQAQQTIRAQYNALGGQTFNADEGVAPVLNFASQPQQLVQQQLVQQHQQSFSTGAVQAPSQNYLPVSY